MASAEMLSWYGAVYTGLVIIMVALSRMVMVARRKDGGNAGLVPVVSHFFEHMSEVDEQWHETSAESGEYIRVGLTRVSIARRDKHIFDRINAVTWKRKTWFGEEMRKSNLPLNNNDNDKTKDDPKEFRRDTKLNRLDSPVPRKEKLSELSQDSLDKELILVYGKDCMIIPSSKAPVPDVEAVRRFKFRRLLSEQLLASGSILLTWDFLTAKFVIILVWALFTFFAYRLGGRPLPSSDQKPASAALENTSPQASLVQRLRSLADRTARKIRRPLALLRGFLGRILKIVKRQRTAAAATADPDHSSSGAIELMDVPTIDPRATLPPPSPPAGADSTVTNPRSGPALTEQSNSTTTVATSSNKRAETYDTLFARASRSAQHIDLAARTMYKTSVRANSPVLGLDVILYYRGQITWCRCQPTASEGNTWIEINIPSRWPFFDTMFRLNELILNTIFPWGWMGDYSTNFTFGGAALVLTGFKAYLGLLVILIALCVKVARPRSRWADGDTWVLAWYVTSLQLLTGNVLTYKALWDMYKQAALPATV